VSNDRHLEIDLSTQDPKDLDFSLPYREKEQTIDAIRKLKLRVTPTSVASESGLSINEASFWLNKVAGETRGKLEVAGDGTIIYSFAPNFTDAYLERGFRRVLLETLNILFRALYWAIRVSFGVALVLSILVVILLIVAALAAILGDSAGDAAGGSGDFFDMNFLGDLFSWDYSPSSSYYPNSVPSVRRNEYHEFVDEHPKGNFFLECFSFLFGDGAPNSNLQQIRWQQIARVIHENGGVVSTEQLAPFLDGDRSDSGMILSALAQFNGRPEVTPSGYIVYIFPDFLVGENQPQVRGENYLHEDHWKFSAFPPLAWLNVLILAILNFAGSWWLFKHIATINFLHSVALLIDVLLTYAILFLAIPAIRYAVITVLNYRIDVRNEKREAAWELVHNPQGDVLEEIQEAKVIRDREFKALSADRKNIVFSSDKDSLEQQFEHP